jgi:hypothetical protein
MLAGDPCGIVRVGEIFAQAIVSHDGYSRAGGQWKNPLQIATTNPRRTSPYMLLIIHKVAEE